MSGLALKWQQLRCGLFGGHLAIVRRAEDGVFEACFLCGKRLGVGWSTRGLTPPRKTQGAARRQWHPVERWRKPA